MPLELTSSAFQEGATIPTKYTGGGANVSPPLKWTEPPGGTQALALICEDPDAPRKTWTHWVIFNLPAGSRELREGVSRSESLPDGSAQGLNDFGEVGYGGPAPPPGKPHRYFFRLYALDQKLDLPPRAEKQQVMKAMEGHVLGQCQLMGTYGRSAK